MKSVKNYHSIILISALSLMLLSTMAQSPVTGIYQNTTSSVSGSSYTTSGAASSPLSGNTYTYAYGANSGYSDHVITLLSIESQGIGYRYESIPVNVTFRRVNNAAITGTRDLMFYFGTISGSNIKLKAPYVDDMTTAFTGNTNLQRGSDNLFANTGDGNGNVNNIERLDVVIDAGISLVSADVQGFALMERGAINQHDAFVVGVITAIDGSGNPTSFSNLLRVNSTHYGSTNVIPNQNSVVVRRDNGSGELKASTGISGQGMGGVFFSFADFGITDGQTVYGYSVAASDFPSSGGASDFVDYTNSTYFPLNTGGSSAGGIDMIALTGIVKIISISGQVMNDINGITDNLVNGPGLSSPSGDQLYVNLVDASNTVRATAEVQSDGTYSFTGVPLGQVNLTLSVNQGVVGNPAPAASLPANWAHASSMAGSGASVIASSGFNTINVGNVNIDQINFGIEQLPMAGTYTFPTQGNPGAANFVTIPSDKFSGTDADGGIITAIKLPVFPSGADAIRIGGTTYTSLNFPPEGILLPTNNSGQLTELIEIDPADGDLTIVIPYHTLDDAGLKSLAPGNVTLIFEGTITVIDNFYPALGPGTLAFEDLWPGKGDYDFNDLVIDYQFEITTNTANMVDEVTATFVVKAFGASFENGFGFQLASGINPEDVAVTGTGLTENIITLNPGGTEAGQSRPTIVVFDNAFAHMPHPGTGIGVNTTPGAPYVAPVTFTVRMVFKPNTYSYNTLDISNFNPFLIVNKVRSHEVHLPGYAPTDLFDTSLFGQYEDKSDPATGKYFVTVLNHPWAINIYERFDYPIEKQDILGVHLKFAEWAMSGGVQFPDWYKNLNGYRNESLIYQIPEN